MGHIYEHDYLQNGQAVLTANWQVTVHGAKRLNIQLCRQEVKGQVHMMPKSDLLASFSILLVE